MYYINISVKRLLFYLLIFVLNLYLSYILMQICMYIKNYICTVILIKIMIQKEEMDLVHNLLIQSLQVFEMPIDLFLLEVCRYGSISKFHIGCLNYIIQTHIKDNL